MARKIKIADSVRYHSDVDVRLAVQQLVHAIDAAKRGDVVDMCTYIRLAADFEQKIPASIRL